LGYFEYSPRKTISILKYYYFNENPKSNQNNHHIFSDDFYLRLRDVSASGHLVDREQVLGRAAAKNGGNFQGNFVSIIFKAIF
jgi:hypothetical protein